MNRDSERSSSAQITNQQGENTSQQIPQPPEGWERFKWLGPSFLWMLSAAGSGELLFTPRIAALYGYSLLWALLATVILKWFINNEVGGFSICTGATILEFLDIAIDHNQTSGIHFTFFWTISQNWENRNYQVAVVS